ncbi:hypothetical protein TUM20983_26330 [Mycobacterium antarcticum]|uniref:colicin D domain-containing protein n=1 Tax=Mycolicibacterium sp. TUM20983 TaxID=3023369 RepID=UPI0023A14E24|nr:colicin D domain-containing protein [Mycolicibacterium sp. TUM20983]GLP75523.1 hypothetical protein TUM20983_26330 [Mycolicibacterium sp. TUM20983]
MEASALVAVSPAFGIIRYNRTTSRYADLYATAEAAAEEYHAVSSALTALGDPIVPCPAIANESDIPAIPMPPVRDGAVVLGPGVELAPETPLTIDRSQIEAKFKHAHDFGVTGSRGKSGFDGFERALFDQVNDPSTLHIAGTYRGSPAILNFDPSSGLVVVQSSTGEFISGWRVSQAQATNILNQGKLGGG